MNHPELKELTGHCFLCGKAIYEDLGYRSVPFGCDPIVLICSDCKDLAEKDKMALEPLA